MPKIKFILLAILAIVAWQVWRRYSGDFVINSADLVFYLGVITSIGGYGLLDAFRYKTPQFICNNVHGSVADPPRRVGAYAIFQLGGFNAQGLKVRGNSGIAVVPYKTMRPHGTHWSSPCMVTKISYKNLPPEILKIVRAENLKPPYYFGLYPDYFKMESLNAQSIIEEYAYTIECLMEHLRNRVGWAENFVAKAGNIKHTFGLEEKTLRKRLSKKDPEEPEEER